MQRDCDVAIIGGGLVGSMASVMLERSGIRTTVLESRPAGREQKVVVGEAITEGSSLFLRHELGLTDWLKANAYRKFGFDFLTLPRGEAAPPPRTFDECHELLLSLTPLEKIPGALARLIPTYHVERTGMNRHLAELARQAGATYLDGASVERVDLGEGRHTVHYTTEGGEACALTARFVLDASGRRAVLARQLGITRPAEGLDTASVWNRFENVNADPAFWSTFHGIDRRRHTIHMTGPGFWIWWIHQSPTLTSVGVSYDREQHQPDVKTEDRGFWEMLAKFPPIADALRGARAREPFQYYAHLPYRSEDWISPRGYALVGDAAWFTDALYSVGIETACRQLIALKPIIVDACRGAPRAAPELDGLNREFDYLCRSVLALNVFKYRHGWARPHVLMQSAVYELAEIAELYHLQKKEWWTPANLGRHYRLQWGSAARMEHLERFLAGCLADGERDLRPAAGLLKKGLIPGPTTYRATWPLWKVPEATPLFFRLIRGWAFSERLAQRSRAWPDALGWMALRRSWNAGEVARPPALAAVAAAAARAGSAGR